MRQLYYTLQTLIRGKGSNLIKIISLGLGLAVSILIFSRQAFELNYDTCYKDHERLCLVKTVWYYNNEYHPSHITLGPVAGTIAENLPDEVESVTVTQQWWSNSAWFANERRFQTNAMTADSCFFATMGIDVVSGDPRELNNPEVVFISRELAGSMFADKNPIGQTVVYNKQMSMTVKGIFEDFPNIKIITHHVGAMIPMLEGRLENGLKMYGGRTAPELRDELTKTKMKGAPIDTIRKFYADTASFGSTSAIRAGIDFFGRDHIVFATDMPFDPEQGPGYIDRTLKCIDNLGLNEDDKAAILHGNAQRLFHV